MASTLFPIQNKCEAKNSRATMSWDSYDWQMVVAK